MRQGRSGGERGSTVRKAENSGLEEMIAEADRVLAGADRALARDYPGRRPGRQPVHTVYVPADRFAPGLAARWGRQALTTLETCAPSPEEFGAAMGLAPGLAADVRSRVLAKLIAEPIEDLRLDFEDGYGDRGDDAEDADARGDAVNIYPVAGRGTRWTHVRLSIYPDGGVARFRVHRTAVPIPGSWPAPSTWRPRSTAAG